MKNVDLDNTMDTLDAWEKKERGAGPSNSREREPLGTVEGFFDKISVVAVKLTGSLKVGDIIEIGNEEDAVRQKVSSMQINRRDVEEAKEGDSVGIKLKYRVSPGTAVYKMGHVQR